MWILTGKNVTPSVITTPAEADGLSEATAATCLAPERGHSVTTNCAKLLGRASLIDVQYVAGELLATAPSSFHAAASEVGTTDANS